MARVMSQKVRQAVLVTGDPVDANELPEKIQLFNELGEPLMLGGGYSRHVQEEPSGMIVSDAVQFDTLTAFPGIRLFKIETDRPARVRIYPTEDYRTADVNRPIGTKPQGDHGRLLEVVTTPTMLSLTLTPEVDMHSQAEFDPDFYVSITNLDFVNAAVVTTYHYFRTE